MPRKPIAEEIFVRELVANGGNPTKAAMKSNKLTNHDSATITGGRYLKRESVQKRLSEVMGEMYPNFKEDLAKLTSQLIQDAFTTDDPKLRLSIVDKLTTLTGLAAPKQSESKSLKANVKVKLPGSD